MTESAQTDWRFPTNAATQYEPREFDEETKKSHMQSELLQTVVDTAAPRFDLGLQHNEVSSLFADPPSNVLLLSWPIWIYWPI